MTSSWFFLCTLKYTVVRISPVRIYGFSTGRRLFVGRYHLSLFAIKTSWFWYHNNTVLLFLWWWNFTVHFYPCSVFQQSHINTCRFFFCGGHLVQLLNLVLNRYTSKLTGKKTILKQSEGITTVAAWSRAARKMCQIKQSHNFRICICEGPVT